MNGAGSSESRLGIGLLGCGFMGRRHLAGYAALQRHGFTAARLTAVCDLDPAVAEAAADLAAHRTGHRPRVHTTPQALIADPEVAAVDIVTDPRTHPALAVAAFEAGRHVLCEKPLALTVRQAATMVAAADRSGRVLATGENYRRGGSNRLARAVLDAGLLGRVHLYREVRIGGDDRVIISPWRHRRAGGSIGLDMAIHYADLIEYLLGPVDQVWGRGLIAEPIRRLPDGSTMIADGEDTVIAGMITADGVMVQLNYLPSGPGRRWGERTVHGSAGSMAVPADRTTDPVIVQLGEVRLTGDDLRAAVGDHLRLDAVTTAVLGPDGTGGPGADFAAIDAGHLAVEIDDFARAALTGGRPEVDGRQGMRSVALVHAVFESGLAGRAVDVAEVLDGSLHAYADDIDRPATPAPTTEGARP